MDKNVELELDQILDEALSLIEEKQLQQVDESLSALENIANAWWSDLDEVRVVVPPATPKAEPKKPEPKPATAPSEEVPHTASGYERAAKRALFWTRHAHQKTKQVRTAPKSAMKYGSAAVAKTADHATAVHMHNNAIQHHIVAADIAKAINDPKREAMHRSAIALHKDTLDWHKARAESVEAPDSELSEKTEFAKLKKATRRGLELRGASETGLKKYGMKMPWTKGARVGQETDMVRGKLYKGKPKIVYAKKRSLPLP